MPQIDDTPAAARATKLADGLELGADGVCRRGKAVAKPTDTPIRDDLPRDHPLYGTRALRCVPSGMTDMVIAADGTLLPAIEPEEPKPIGEIEVTPRGR